MSFQVDTALVNAYRSNIEIQFQQKGSRLRPYVRQEPQNAEFEFYDRIGPTDVVENTGRHQDTPFVGTDHSRRRVGLRDFDWADLVDKKDKLRMLADPTSPYTQNAIMAFGRKADSLILAAAEATAYTGKTGATPVVFDTNMDVAVNYVETGSAVNSNLTIGKLRRAKFLFDSNESVDDGEMLIAAITASQTQALLRTTEVTNEDYNTVKALAEGKVDTFMGFKFIRTELVRKSGNIRYCIFFATQGILLATAQAVEVDVGPRRDKRNSTQIYVCASMEATRMWEAKVVRVACDETA